MLKKLTTPTSLCFKMNIIVDSDCGLDDIFALSLLDAAPNLRIKCISTVNGLNNTNDGAAMMETLFKSSLFSNRPSIIHGSVPLSNPAKLRDTDWYDDYKQTLEGVEKIIDSSKDFVDCREVVASLSDKECISTPISSLSSYLSCISSAEQNNSDGAANVLLCIGPLTNIAALIKSSPNALLQSVSRVVIMGGAVHGPGNCEHGAEFNFFMDPQAAHDVIHHSGVPIELISLDVANGDAFIPADLSPAVISDHASEPSGEGTPTAPKFETKGAFLQYLQATFPDSASYDSVTAYYVANSATFVMQDVRVFVDPVTGVVHNLDANLLSGTVITEEMRESAVVISTAINFDRSSYVNYIRNLLEV